MPTLPKIFRHVTRNTQFFSLALTIVVCDLRWHQEHGYFDGIIFLCFSEVSLTVNLCRQWTELPMWVNYFNDLTKFSRTSMGLTGLGPWKKVLAKGSSTHPGWIMHRISWRDHDNSSSHPMWMSHQSLSHRSCNGPDVNPSPTIHNNCCLLSHLLTYFCSLYYIYWTHMDPHQIAPKKWIRDPAPKLRLTDSQKRATV